MLLTKTIWRGEVGTRQFGASNEACNDCMCLERVFIVCDLLFFIRYFHLRYKQSSLKTAKLGKQFANAKIRSLQAQALFVGSSLRSRNLPPFYRRPKIIFDANKMATKWVGSKNSRGILCTNIYYGSAMPYYDRME